MRVGDLPGIIVRLSRKCLEIKALDEQECVRSDMAVCAFARALLRCRQLPVTDHEHLISLLDDAIKHGTEGLHADLEQMYAYAWKHATGDERVPLPVIRDMIENGSLTEQMRDRLEQGDDIITIMGEMARCLRDNHPFCG